MVCQFLFLFVLCQFLLLFVVRQFLILFMVCLIFFPEKIYSSAATLLATGPGRRPTVGSVPFRQGGIPPGPDVQYRCLQPLVAVLQARSAGPPPPDDAADAGHGEEDCFAEERVALWRAASTKTAHYAT